MKMRVIILVSAAFFVAACAPRLAFCRTSQLPTEPNDLRSFLQKGYAAARSILEDVQMEYQHEQVQRVDRAVFEEIFESDLKETSSYTVVETYLQKHGKERWAFLYIGSSPPPEDVSHRAELIGTRDSSRFKVFDGQRLLDYLPVKDGYTPIELADITYTLRKLDLHPAMDEEKVFSTSPSRLPAGVDVIDHVKGSRYFVGEGARATSEALPAIRDE